jgi:glucoamylase
MYFGKSAGSAQPLVWAHSEYLKLLRSVTDGQIFDRISAVEERYAVPTGERTFANRIEIFQMGRPISFLPAGHTLRIVDRARFRIVYTFDGWATVLHLDSRNLGRIGYFADIPTTAGQGGSVIFTLCWPSQSQDQSQPDRWLGKNLEVVVIPPSATAESQTVSLES